MTAGTPEVARQIAIDLTKGGEIDVRRIIREGTQLSAIASLPKGEDVLSGLLVILISDFNTSLNVVRPMKPAQVADLALDLALEYWDYRIEDFICFFHMAKRGMLSDRENRIMDRVDTQLIYGLLKNYDKQRIEKILEANNDYKLSDPVPHPNAIEIPSDSMSAILERSLKKGGRPLTRKETEKLLGRKISDEAWDLGVNGPKKEEGA